MKSLFIVFLTLFLLKADELQRIESIISDISKLRVEHEECRSASEAKNASEAQIIQNSKNKIKNYKSVVKIKEEEIKNLKNQITILEKKKPKIVVKKVIKEVIVEKKIYLKDENIFPILMPKNADNERVNILER